MSETYIGNIHGKEGERRKRLALIAENSGVVERGEGRKEGRI
jgi:hypothetical protein